VKKFLRSTLALTLLLAGAAVARAQAAKPVLVISIPSYNDILANVDFLGKLAGQPAAAQQMDQMVGLFAQGLKGLDRTRPIGVVVSSEGSDFTPLAFVPTTNLKDLMQCLPQLAAQEDAGGFKVMSPAGEAFIREQNGWAFISQSKDAAVPADPMQWLGGLKPEYDFALRIYLQNVPADKKKSGIDLFKMFMDQAAAMQRQQGGDNPLAALSQKNMQEQVKAIERLLNEADQLTIGWKLDRQAKNTHLDFTVTAVPGSELAQEIKQAGDAKTNFAGFLMPDAAATLSFCGRSSPDSIAQAKATLEQIRARAELQIDNDANLPDDKTRAAVKDVLKQLLDVAQKTVETGKSDGGGVLLLGPNKFQAAVGGFIADGPALESAVKKLIDMAKAEKEFQQLATVKLDLDTYKEVRFHQVSVKLPPEADENCRKVFGDMVDIYIGAGKESVYIGLGKGSLDLVKSVIDQSAAQANKPVPPVQLAIAMGPIFDFASSMDPGNPQLSEIAKAITNMKGKDRVLMNGKMIPNGVTYRLELEEGVLNVIGAAIQSSMHRMGPGPG